MPHGSPFADVLATPQSSAIVAVDAPIGLPEWAGHGVRPAENVVFGCSIASEMNSPPSPTTSMRAYPRSPGF